ncbi:hypothetical protein I6A60_00415 [Frankia sp. AgB1.9]|nr:hypothetical protein [Frankia sp. AgW1.1]MBL7546351.1 hypothetical protein [Frankia sp. AgB1.9]MBL7618603.1 hypothetical protein [Frankia sp. AgB1.8]
MVDVADLAEVLGISKSRADALTRQKGFPDPAIDRPRYRAWWRHEVTAWLDTHRDGWGGWPDD